MGDENNVANEVKLGDFPYPLTDGPTESRYLTWVRNHSNYMAERGFLDYFRMVAVLARGILINSLTLLPYVLLVARGLLSYLLSRPDDWKVLVKDLQRRGDLRRDGIYKLLKELREAGYVRFQRARDHEGRIRGGTYYVSEISRPPHPDLPDTA